MELVRVDGTLHYLADTTKQELEEADELYYCNQIEIQELKDYIALLQSLLEKNGIEFPDL